MPIPQRLHTCIENQRSIRGLERVRFYTVGMFRRAQFLTCQIVLVAFLSALLTSQANAQQCHRVGTLTATLNVFDRPPTFSTAQGATQGIRVAVLAKGSVVYVCREITVGFGVSTSSWSQVSYYTSSQWHFGWALSSDIKVTANETPTFDYSGFIASAVAANESQPQELQPQLTIGVAPPNGAIGPNAPPGPPSAIPAGVLEPELWLWLYLLIALIAGIVGQTMVDIMSSDAKLSRREIRRRTVTAFIYSPIVFLVFVQTSQFDIATNKQLLVIVLLAFQAGFFWQKLFEKSKAANG